MYSEEEREEILRKIKTEKSKEEEDQQIREYQQKQFRDKMEEFNAKLRAGIPREDLIDPRFVDPDFEKTLKKIDFERIV